MQSSSRNIEKLIWGGLVLVIIGVVAAYFLVGKGRLGAASSPLPYLRELPAFALTNQLGNQATLNQLIGKVWIADIIFTRCPGPCARMTKQFAELQSALASEPSVHLVSLTADPEFDTTRVLAEYGNKYGTNPERWWFLTGPKREIYSLATEGLMLALVEKEEQERTVENDLFIHSTLFVLVDKRGNVRGVYESTEPQAQEKMLADTRGLLKER